MKEKKENKTLSIIIPHFNSVQSLQKLLESIPKRKEIQILVIDDKSDLEKEMFQRLSKDRQYNHVEFIRNETQKKGAGSCRNIGLERAVGEWVMFADADDYFLKDFYDKIREYFASEVELVFFSLTSINLESGSTSDRHIEYNKILHKFLASPTKVNENRLRYCTNVPYSKLIKRELIVSGGIEFDHTLVANDVMFSTKVGGGARRIEVSRERIYCVTCGEGTLTKIRNKETFNIRYGVFANQYGFVENQLTEKEFTELNLNGRQILKIALQYRLGLKGILGAIIRMRKQRIKVIGSLKEMNPVSMCKRAKNI